MFSSPPISILTCTSTHVHTENRRCLYMAPILWRLSVLLFGVASAFPYEGELFARQNNRCGGDSSLTPCGSGFPDNFCCGANSRCVPLNNTRIVTTICCPLGRDCARIQPIACNVTLQNARLLPASPVHTLNLTEALPKCGNLCCPAGFRCENNECLAINNKQQQSSSTARPPSSSAPATTSRPANGTTTSTSTRSTQSQTMISSSTAIPVETTIPVERDTFSGRSFAAGFVPGIIIGAALLFGIIFFIARRRNRKEEATEMTSPPGGGSGGLSSAKAAFKRRSTRRQISDPIVQPQYSTRTAFYHNAGSQRTASPGNSSQTAPSSVSPAGLDASIVEKGPHSDHSRKRSSSYYDTNTVAYPATPYSHTTSDFRVKSLFHQSPNPATGLATSTAITPMPPVPPIPASSSPTTKGSNTPPNPLRSKKSQGSLRRQLSRFRKGSAPEALSRTSSKRRRVGSWSSGDDRSLSGDERGGRESRGTIRVVMSPPHREPLPMGFGPVLKANMPPPSMQGSQNGQQMQSILPLGMAYGSTKVPYPAAVQQYPANTGEKLQQGQGYFLNTPPQPHGGVQGLGSPYTPSKVRGGNGEMLGEKGSRETTFGEMMERAGVQAGRRDLERARGPLYGS